MKAWPTRTTPADEKARRDKRASVYRDVRAALDGAGRSDITIVIVGRFDASPPTAVRLFVETPTDGCPRYRLQVGGHGGRIFHERKGSGFDVPEIVAAAIRVDDARKEQEARYETAAKVRKEARRIMRLHGLREGDAVSIEERGGRLRFVMDAEVTAEQAGRMVEEARACGMLGARKAGR